MPFPFQVYLELFPKMVPGTAFARHISSSRGAFLRNARHSRAFPFPQGSTSSFSFLQGGLPVTGGPTLSTPVCSSGSMSVVSSSLRFFSSDASKQLVKTIEKEIEHETTNFEEDKEAQNFLSKGGWTLEESKNDMMVTLTKQKGGKKVTVEFSCIQTGETVGEEGGESPGGEMSDFTVSIQNPDESGVSFFCSTTQDEEEKFRYCIGQIRIFDNVKEKENISIYPGPYFEDLDDSFQQSLDEWLAQHDIDAELCDFIDRYAAEKEQKEYVQWLKKFQKFVQ